MNHALILRQLSIGYPTKVVADGIDATLNTGELTCLIGPNGVGKSTLLKTLAGFIPPLGGDCLIVSGKTPTDESRYSSLISISPEQRARLISVVLTFHGDLQNMTVEELVAMGRAPYTGFWGKLRDCDVEAVQNAMEQVGIAALSKRLVMTLSDGERQKAMIAKAIAQETPVIFLDEPTAFLDFPSKVETMQLLRRLCRESGKTVFLSTHDVEIALQMADRLWIYNDGCLSIGTPDELASNGIFARFVERDGVKFQAETKTLQINKER